MKLTGAQILIRKLEARSIRYIAGIPGGNNLPIYHELKESRIEHVLARHEQGAAFIAHGMARSTRQPAICLATSGPGAANLVTAISDAYSDGVPIIAITGQVPRSLKGTNAFQEIDSCALFATITKGTRYITSASELSAAIDWAFKLACEGKPGPVLLDIPKDVQTETTDQWNLMPAMAPVSPAQPAISRVQELLKRIQSARRPVIIAGGGILSSGTAGSLLEMAEKSNIPVCTTLMGLSGFPSQHPLCLGMPGMHGRQSTNHLLHQADLIIALGIRFDDRVTGNMEKFCPQVEIAHINIEACDLRKTIQPGLAIQADLRQFFPCILPHLTNQDRASWHATIRQTQIRFQEHCITTTDPFHPEQLLPTLASLAPEHALVTTDVGQHQMWVAQHYPFTRPGTLLTSGGQGTMGFGLPAAIGAALVHRNRTVLAFCGDGSLLMNIQELATLADLKLPVKILVMNNGLLGMVHQQQDLFYESHYMASEFQTRVDYVATAKAFGITAFELSGFSRATEQLEDFLNCEGPGLLNIPIHPSHQVYPIVPPGEALYQAWNRRPTCDATSVF